MDKEIEISEEMEERAEKVWENPELMLRLIDLIFLGNEKSIPS